MGLFNPLIREIAEMSYQNANDYYFNSDKFCNRFQFKPTPERDALKSVFEEI